MRKLDRLLMGIFLPVCEGLSTQIAKASTSYRDPILNVNTHSLSYVFSRIRRRPSNLILSAYLLLHMIKFRIYQ
jgi:hypothetical protein